MMIKLVEDLVDENILPVVDDSNTRLHILNTFKNRTVLFNLLYRMGIKVSDGVLLLDDKTLTVDVAKVDEIQLVHKKSNRAMLPKTCYIFNREHLVLSQECEDIEYSFSKDPALAVGFYKKMANTLLDNPKFENCYMVEIHTGEEEQLKSVSAIDFLINLNCQSDLLRM